MTQVIRTNHMTRSAVVPPAEVWDLGSSKQRHRIQTLQTSKPIRQTHSTNQHPKTYGRQWVDLAAWNPYVLGIVFALMLFVLGLVLLDGDDVTNNPYTQNNVIEQSVGSNLSTASYSVE